VLPRVIRMPDRVVAKGSMYVLLSSVIRAHLADLFTGREVTEFSQFRVTRHSDLAVDEEDVRNLRTALRKGLQQRHFGQAVRLEVSSSCSPFLADFLQSQFGLPSGALFHVHGPVNLVRLSQLVDLVNDPALLFPPWRGAWPVQLQQSVPILAQLASATCSSTSLSSALMPCWPFCARPYTTRMCWSSNKPFTARVQTPS